MLPDEELLTIFWFKIIDSISLYEHCSKSLNSLEEKSSKCAKE